MAPWTCPNTKCAHDGELQPGQTCPLCGEQAKEFKFSELDSLWKQKWDFKKSIDRTRKQEKILSGMKFCPKCGSTNLIGPIFYRPSVWKCLDCRYEGSFIIEDSKLAEKIREQRQKDESAQ